MSSMSIPIRSPKDQTLQTRWLPRSAHRPDRGPTAGDGNFHDGFPGPPRPTGTLAPGLAACRKQRDATELRSVIFSLPTAQKPTPPHGSHKRAKTPEAAWSQTSRDNSTAWQDRMNVNSIAATRRTDDSGAAGFSSPNLLWSSAANPRNPRPGQISNIRRLLPEKHQSKSPEQKTAAPQTHCPTRTIRRSPLSVPVWRRRKGWQLVFALVQHLDPRMAKAVAFFYPQAGCAAGTLEFRHASSDVQSQREAASRRLVQAPANSVRFGPAVLHPAVRARPSYTLPQRQCSANHSAHRWATPRPPDRCQKRIVDPRSCLLISNPAAHSKGSDRMLQDARGKKSAGDARGWAGRRTNWVAEG